MRREVSYAGGREAVMMGTRGTANCQYVRYLIAKRGWSAQVEASAEYEVELALDYLKRERVWSDCPCGYHRKMFGKVSCNA